MVFMVRMFFRIDVIGVEWYMLLNKVIFFGYRFVKS